MKFTKMLSAGCLAAAVSASGLVAQDEPVQVRIRAIQKDGKVEVIEERLSGPEEPVAERKLEKKNEKKEDTDDARPEAKAGANEDATIRARVLRRLKSVAEEAIAEHQSSEYWIGVQLAPVPPEVQKHLAVKHGILIISVYDDSPAKTAGIQVDDILLEAGEAKIETPTDLIKAVEAAKTNELKFKILREGKEQTIAVTPVKRAPLALTLAKPEGEAGTRMERLQAAQKQFERALEALRAETAEEGAVDFMLVRPGAFLARTAEAKMPDDLTIQITKTGNKPAQINVKKGDKSWDVTADKLDDLPKEIRPFVEQMTSGPQATLAVTSPQGRFSMNIPPGKPGFPPPVVVPLPPGVPPLPALPAVPGTPAVAPVAPRVTWSAPGTAAKDDAKLDQILKKLESLTNPALEEMKKELQSLRKEVEELRKSK